MKRSRIPFLFVLLVLLLAMGVSSCSLQNIADDTIEGFDQTVDAQVAATLTAVATAEAPTETPVPETGIIRGKLSYPSEFLPGQHVVAFRVGTDEWYDTTTADGQNEYEINNLPAGTYFVVAYLLDSNTADESILASAAYTQAVTCGLSVDCTDHSLVNVVVSPGQILEDINPQDWYASPEDRTWPGDPTLPTVADPGSISGGLAFPSEYLPAQHVVAFEVGTNQWYDTTTTEGQDDYTITDIPPGTYIVVAYLTDAQTAQESLEMSAGYTMAVPCGLSIDCTDHSMKPVSVTAGQDVTDVDPTDWYVPPEEKSWPADPTLPESTGQTGISGSLSYPSEFVPPQRVVAFNLANPAEYYVTEVTQGGTYTLELPAGTYQVVSYLIDPADIGATPGLAGGYSEAVPCGLAAGCTNHLLLPVEVGEGEMVTEINPIDWYLPPQSFDLWPSDPLVSDEGAIAGALGYPSEGIPPLRVIAFNIYSGWYFYVDTMGGQTSYVIDGLPVGTYHVVAFVKDTPDFPGAYSYAVDCGLSVECTDHSLVDVFVYPGMTAQNADPIDFYADPDQWEWPDDPTQ